MSQWCCEQDSLYRHGCLGLEIKDRKNLRTYGLIYSFKWCNKFTNKSYKHVNISDSRMEWLKGFSMTSEEFEIVLEIYKELANILRDTEMGCAISPVGLLSHYVSKLYEKNITFQTGIMVDDVIKLIYDYSDSSRAIVKDITSG